MIIHKRGTKKNKWSIMSGIAFFMLICCFIHSNVFAATETWKRDSADFSVLQDGSLLEEQLTRKSTISDEQYKLAEERITKALDNLEESCDLTGCKITSTDFKQSGLLSAILNHNPRYFYVTGGCSWYYDSDGYVTEVTFVYRNNMDELKDKIAAYDAAVQKAVSGADASWSDMEKALYINDYLCRLCAYASDTENDNVYSAYGVFVEKEAVCNGYSLAFMELAKQMGLTCEFVSSSSLNHAWNIVKVNGTYYYVDSTWNDPVSDMIGRARHVYFLKSYDYFANGDTSHSTHLKSSDWVLTGGLDSTAASDSSYDSYFWNQVDTGFSYANGSWYGMVKNSSSVSASVTQYACDGATFTSDKVIATVSKKWPVWDQAGYTWSSNFSGMGSCKNCLYYTDCLNIYLYDMSEGKSSVYYTLSAEEQAQGYLYGMDVDAYGNIRYLVASNPNALSSGVIHSVAYVAKISYELDGGTNHKENPSEFTNQEDFTLREPTKEYFTFEGWYTDPDFTTEIKILKAGECEDITLYAKWKESAHVYGSWEVYKESTCYSVGELRRYCELCGAYESDVMPLKEHNYGDWYIVTPATCSNKGIRQRDCQTEGCTAFEVEELPLLEHDYGDWYVDVEPGCLTTGLKKRTCKACETSEEKEIPSLGHDFQLTDAKPATYREKGHGAGSVCSRCGEVQGDVSVEPELTFVISFDGNGAESGTMDPQTDLSYLEGGNIAPAAFEKEHYELTGWNTKADGTGDAFLPEDDIRKLIDLVEENQGTVTLYAVWTEQTRTIVLDGNGSISDPMDGLDNITSVSDVSLPLNTYQRTGFEFTGWNSKPDGSGVSFPDGAKAFDVVQGTEAYGTNETIILYAQWQWKGVTVVYHLEEGRNHEDNPELMPEEGMVLAPASKTGFIFGGWYLDEAHEKPVDALTLANLDEAIGEDGQIHLYAKWEAYQYHVKFNGNGATSGTMKEIEGSYKEGMKLPANTYKKTGYTFLGWKGSDGNLYQDEDDLMKLSMGTPVKTITLTARWEAAAYSITYYLNGGKNNAENPSTYTCETDTITLRYPSKRGYTFGGWYSDSDFKNRVRYIENGSTGKKTLYAKWTATRYKVTYVLNGGYNNQYNPLTYTVTTNHFSYKPATRKGYRFLGWYSDKACTKRTYQVKKGSVGNKTVYAKWTLNRYKITYVLNGGKNNRKNPTTYTIYTATTAYQNPTRSGYRFAGWYTDKACTKRTYQVKKGSTGNKTVYAKWIKK